MKNLTEALNIDFLPYINIGYTLFAPLHFLFFYPMPILLLENAMASSVIFSLDAIKQWKEKTFRTNEGSILSTIFGGNGRTLNHILNRNETSCGLWHRIVVAY